MAMHLPMFSPVMRAHSCVPSAFIVIETSAVAPRWAYCSVASVTTEPSSGALPSGVETRMA